MNIIINKYNNEDLRTNINSFFTDLIINYAGEFSGKNFIVNSYIEYCKIYFNKKSLNVYINQLIKSLRLFNDNVLKIYNLMIDIYFLRKILDKDYIKNIITYCNRTHLVNYIYFLVKYCDFKIDKIYNSNGLSLAEFANQIKETKYNDLNKIHNLFLIEGEKSLECIIKESPYYLLGW